MAKKGITEDLHEVPLGLGCREIVGSLDGQGLSIGLAVSRYNAELTHALLREAMRILVDAGVAMDAICVVWVPGAYEVPAALEQLARAGTWDALVGLGVVIEGETNHADIISRSVAARLGALSASAGVPVIDGVVCAPTLAQAELRCRPGAAGRGAYLARAAIEMARVFRALRA